MASYVEAPRKGGDGLTWERILTLWEEVRADLLQIYGIDVDDSTAMAGRTFHWLRSKILQLLTLPPTYTEPMYEKGRHVGSRRIPASRLGWALSRTTRSGR